MGLLDCVASPEGRDSFEVTERRPIYKPHQISRSDHDISRRRALPLFSSQSSLKNVRDVDFWRQRVVRFLFAPEGREDVRVLKVPLNLLGYAAITDFIGAIPNELFEEYQSQPPPDEGLLKDDKVFWVRDGIAEPGTFKWKGNIGTDSCVGLQLDRKKAVPFGTYDGKGLFYCKPGHRALVLEHEVIPYKKFLRSFLGVPPRKDSLIGSSVRLSAKAIAAKNAKPGDRIYLPKEKKWANVQWIGKIDGETVVDIIYEPPKPEAGMPVSPDEPCISRSFSMADFIDEVGASEPNTPVAAQPPQEQPKTEEPTAPTKPLPPSPPPLSSDESEDSDLTTSDDDDDDDDESESDEVESEAEEREIEAKEEESDNDEGEREVKAVKSETETENSVSQESINLENAPASKRSSLHSAASNKRPSLHVNELQDLQKDVPEAQLSPQATSPTLPSPKRKGFFKFSPNKKRSKSPRPVTPVEEPEIEDLPSPTEPENERSSVLRPAKSSNIFSSLRFKKSKKPAKEVEIAEPEEIEEPKQVPKKKNKSEWSIIFFKPKNKSPIEKLTLAQSSRVECTTPIDEMIPPDKIPTPPPKTDEINERRIERPEFISFPSLLSGEENRRKGLGKPVEPPMAPETFSGASSQHLKETSLSPDDNSSESESSESDADLNEGSQQVAATVEMHVPPIETSVPVNLNRQEQNLPANLANMSESESSDDEQIPEREVSPPPASNESSELPTEKLEELPTNQPIPLDKFKETKIRNRPASFGSFLKRIKNLKPKPDEGQKIPTSPTVVHDPSLEGALPVVTQDKNTATEEEIASPIWPQQIQDAKPLKENTPETEGYKMLTDSESSLSDAGVQKEDLGEPKVVAQVKKSLVRPSSTVEGDQEGIILDLLDVDEPTPPFISPPPVPAEDSPKRKQSWNRSFSFSFSKKRKASQPQTPTTPTPLVSNESRDFDKENEENSESSKEQGHEEPHGEKENDQKSSIASSFRNSFRRTFSLTKKRPTSVDLESESVKSPPSSINRPRPVTLYFDNNEVVEARQSFRNKRPASVVVDIQPWSNRRGGDGIDIYNSPRSSGEFSTSPLKSPNPALEPKQAEPAIPRHRIFTTPSIFIRKNKKAEEQVFTPKPAKTSLYKKWNSAEVGAVKVEQPQTPIDDVASPSDDQPPPLPTTPPPIIETEKPASNFPFVESGGSIDGQSPKLKSALKQRKEIDCIPNGLKINDRVMWYSGREPVPGTVQRLFKDGTDKYTAMVKFDREVKHEPLRLVREGDAYMITVEELITPGMFTPTNFEQNDTTPNQTISAPQTPMSPSVRFDNVKDTEQHIPQVTITEVNDELDLPPPFQEEEVNMACGFNRGIQCRDRTCCLETVLFSLFYTTNAFDIAMLYGNSPNEDSLTKSVRTILRREIVDPLRREGFCAWPAIKKLRDAVKPLSDEWQTLSTDAEVMMFILFDRALKLGKFISYSNDMSDYLHQLVVDTKDLSKSTTVQHLFETSLQLMDKLKLKTIPTPALIMEMPRSNDKLVQYKAVIPNLSLHFSRVLDDGSRLCICGVVAKHECRKCSANFGSRSIVFCDNCKGTADIIHFQLTHQAELISLNQTIVIMDLAAILCVKQGHYSSFVRCGNEKFSPWVYFDGGEAENPKVCIEQNLGMWLDRLEKYPGKYQDALQYPLLTHILQDSHICVYQPREKSSSV